MAKFSEGHEKRGGRKAGTPNKRLSVMELCQSMGLDPFKEMAKLAGDAENPRQFEALKELCQYIEPKKKQTEVSLDPEKSTIRIIVEDYTAK